MRRYETRIRLPLRVLVLVLVLVFVYGEVDGALSAYDRDHWEWAPARDGRADRCSASGSWLALDGDTWFGLDAWHALDEEMSVAGLSGLRTRRSAQSWQHVSGGRGDRLLLESGLRSGAEDLGAFGRRNSRALQSKT